MCPIHFLCIFLIVFVRVLSSLDIRHVYWLNLTWLVSLNNFLFIRDDDDKQDAKLLLLLICFAALRC